MTDHGEQLCHKVKARAVLRQEEMDEVEEGLVLETPLLMAEGEGLVLQENGISFIRLPSNDTHLVQPLDT